MKKHYLPFEKPLKDLDFEIEKLSNSESDNTKLNQLIDERKELEKEIFSDLSSWETVQLARHPNRPYTLDYINTWLPEIIEISRRIILSFLLIAGLTLKTFTILKISNSKRQLGERSMNRDGKMVRFQAAV